jgi:hypothetical protein
LAKSAKHRVIAMRFALYIEALGEKPLPLEHRSYRKYAASLGQQYEGLRVKHGSEQTSKARATARAEIRKLTLRVAAAGLVPDMPPTPPKVRSKRSGTAKTARPRTNPTVPDTSPSQTQAVLPQSIDEVTPKRKDLWNCRRKLSHFDYLSALLHARRLPPDPSNPALNIYPCFVWGGLHVGRSKS